jgi:hypothetical protein
MSAKNSNRFHRDRAYLIIKQLESEGTDSMNATREQVVKASRAVFSGYSGKYDTPYHRKKSREAAKKITQEILEGSARSQTFKKFTKIVISERKDRTEKKTSETELRPYWEYASLIAETNINIKSVEGIKVSGNNIAERVQNALFIAGAIVRQIDDDNSDVQVGIDREGNLFFTI